MTAKEFLSQYRLIDTRIRDKLEQIRSLRELAEKCTSAVSASSGKVANGDSAMEKTIIAMVDMEKEVQKEMDDLVRLRKEISDAIKTVENKEYRTLLEKRYLEFFTMKEIADDMWYDVRHIYRMHDEALKFVLIPESCQ
jgi:DNA-directed RNA polymerase specialized sigma subunit